jgi:glyoxylase-like metal-dependent hydrolase (beta-lactamase superfamily II)
MEQVIPGLYASAPEPLSFAPGARIRAFLLRRPLGNLLVYANGKVVEEAEAITGLGGVTRHYLNHWHEAGMGCAGIAGAFGAPVLCNEADRAHAAESCAVAESFSERHSRGDDFEVVPTPGHTAGATAFLWRTGRHRCLFTSDTLSLGQDGDWRVAVLETSDRAAYLDSLALIRELEFDVLVPWIAPASKPFVTHVDRAEAGRRLDRIIGRVQDGAER